VLDSIQNSPANPVVGGLSVAINVDGLAVWQGVTGYAARNYNPAVDDNSLLPGGTPMTTETISHMYSVTKTFTSPLVLELAKEGYFSLEDPVIKWIPFLGYINSELDGTVTIRQLLAHESGWSDYPSEQMTFPAVAVYPDKVFTPYEVLSFVHQIAPKGTVRNYSSTNYTTLGAIIENATGKPVEQHYRERFFTPLGLSSMYLSIREPQPAGTVLAAPHDNFFPLNQVFEAIGSPLRFPYAWTNVSGLPFTAIHSMAFTGGGLVTNASDLARWGNNLFGGRATSAATLQTMMNSIATTPDASGDYLGYGIWTNNKISETDYFVGHNGRAPGYRSVMMYQTDRKMTIAVLSNFSGLRFLPDFQGVDSYDIAKALYNALPKFVAGNENRKEAKIVLCFNGKTITVDRSAAAGFIQKGAYLGPCHMPTDQPAKAVAEQLTTDNGMKVYPNPVSANATISFAADAKGTVNVALYDFNGKQVSTLFNGTMEKGATRTLNLNTVKLANGTYFCRIQSAAGILQQKVVVMK
jgi:D-alanyl-D-alanine carboxypeptidase